MKQRHSSSLLVLTAHETYSLGPTLLGKKIGEETGVHIPHNTIYRILLPHDNVEPCTKRRTQRYGNLWSDPFFNRSSGIF